MAVPYALLIATFVASTRATDNKWQLPRSACLIDNNDKEVTDVTLEECMERCEQETDFTCRSVDYYPLKSISTYTCYLSAESAETVGYGELSMPCHVNHRYVYIQRSTDEVPSGLT